MSKATIADMRDRITEYLKFGGLFNPELMDHGKVRDLLLDIDNVLFMCEAAISNAKQPDLLEACELADEVFSICEEDTPRVRLALATLRAAISKAKQEGE